MAEAKTKTAAPQIHTDDLFKDFKEHSVAEFFKKNKQMLGFSGKIRSLTTIVHEYVSNSLDACETAGILPDIHVKLDQLGPEHYQLIIRDNGPGMPEQIAAKALGQLLAGTKFHRLAQSRGQQGIGASGCTMYSLMTTGKPTHLITGTTKGQISEMDVAIDVKKNAPVVTNVKTREGNDIKGTKITAEFKDVQYVESSKGPLEYVRRTALANPHASFEFVTPDGRKIKFQRTSNQIPLPAETILPHPKGTTTDELMELSRKTEARKVSGMLKADFSRMGDKKIEEIQAKCAFDLNISPNSLTWKDAEEIANAIKGIDFMAPQTDILRPIGPERIEKSLKTIVEPEFITVSERPPKVYMEGRPFQVECGIAYGGGAGRQQSNGGSKGDDEEVEGQVALTATGKGLEIMRFANKTPLMFDEGACAITQAIKSVDWKRYGIKDIENEPVTIFIDVCSVKVPYTSAGKQAISDEEEIVQEIRQALMDAGRKIDRFVRGKAHAYEAALKKKRLEMYIPETVKAIAFLSGENEGKLEKKMREIIEKKFDEIDAEGESEEEIKEEDEE